MGVLCFYFWRERGETSAPQALAAAYSPEELARRPGARRACDAAQAAVERAVVAGAGDARAESLVAEWADAGLLTLGTSRPPRPRSSISV